MAFERLPNELILHLFEYLSFRDLFRAVYGLNKRFDQLLCLQFQKFHLDFRLVSKFDLQHICHNYLALIRNQTISLRLSNDDCTPRQIQLFLSLSTPLHQLVRLQFISLAYLQSKDTLEQIMIECSSLPFLRSLEFTDGHIVMTQDDAVHFYDYIWNLPKLTYCYLDINFAYENYFPSPRVVSTSLRHLVVHHTYCSLFTLTKLSARTPNLDRLSTSFNNEATNEFQISSPLLSLTRLEMEFRGDLATLRHLLKNLPNIQHLTIGTYDFCVRGDQWEDMIDRYLPKLNVLRFKMRSPLSTPMDMEMQMNVLLDTFRTKFWTEKCQWFVRCHGYASDESNQYDRLEIFTLPYMFDHLNTYMPCVHAQSTCLTDQNYLTCSRVKDLYYTQTFFTKSILSDVRLKNIEDLSLSFPFDESWLSIMLSLDRLVILYIFTNENANPHAVESQLQCLLGQTRHLRELAFGIWSTADSQVPSMNLISRSVRCLRLQGYTVNHDLRCYDTTQCSQLTQSPLGMQCETLVITVKSRDNVLHLVNDMPNLQALTVKCNDDDWADRDAPNALADDDLLIWLGENLPSSSIIARDGFLQSDVHIWIR